MDINNIELNTEEMNTYINALLEKSEEAYLLALEIINKPTIKYRTEGFCFFVCNAWELLLKAFIIRRENDVNAISFKHNPNQTLGLMECIEKIFTSTTDYTKANLNYIREIRNKSTHSFLPEYDFTFASVFQRCVSNYNIFVKKHFPDFPLNKQVSAFVALSNLPDGRTSFLSLNPRSLFQLKMLEDKISSDINEDSISQTIKLVSTKKSKEADIRFSISDDADGSVHFITVPKDVNETHPYSAKEAVKKIKETLIFSMGTEHGFTMTTFINLCRDMKVRDNQSFCYEVDYGKSRIKKYSESLIEYLLYVYSRDGGTKNKD